MIYFKLKIVMRKSDECATKACKDNIFAIKTGSTEQMMNTCKTFVHCSYGIDIYTLFGQLRKNFDWHQRLVPKIEMVDH